MFSNWVTILDPPPRLKSYNTMSYCVVSDSHRGIVIMMPLSQTTFQDVWVSCSQSLHE